MDNSDYIDRRKSDRSEFAYPVEIMFLSEIEDSTLFHGYIENISIGGSCIQFEDRYGRLSQANLSDTKVKLFLFMPEGEKVAVLSRVKRIQRNTPKQFFIEIGIEFENLEEWQEKAMKKLAASKKKDQNIMWNLWKQYEKKV
ncbi:MAG: PilZ domain-containing protein [Nitrospirota bacterium]